MNRPPILGPEDIRIVIEVRQAERLLSKALADVMRWKAAQRFPENAQTLIDDGWNEEAAALVNVLLGLRRKLPVAVLAASFEGRELVRFLDEVVDKAEGREL